VQKKFLFGFFYRFIGEKIFGQQNCIALFDFFLKNCVSVSLYRYIFEYRCPSLSVSITAVLLKLRSQPWHHICLTHGAICLVPQLFEQLIYEREEEEHSFSRAMGVQAHLKYLYIWICSSLEAGPRKKC
jgi:hypothetical protein